MATKRINLVLDAPYSVAKQLKFQRVSVKRDATGQRYVLSIKSHEFGGDSDTDIPDGEYPVIAYAHHYPRGKGWSAATLRSELMLPLPFIQSN
jgi:hypothetical protein